MEKIELEPATQIDNTFSYTPPPALRFEPRDDITLKDVVNILKAMRIFVYLNADGSLPEGVDPVTTENHFVREG